MRKQYKIILFILILFLSIGFAYLTANLDITGSITFKDNIWDVHLENIVVEEDSVDADKPIINNDNTSTSFNISMNRPGDYYEFYVDVVNNGTMDATLDSITRTSLTGDYATYLNYSVTYYSDREITKGDLLRSGLKERIKVRVEYKYDLDTYKKLDDINLSLSLKYIKTDTHDPNYNSLVWNFDSIGELDKFKIPKTGMYKIEVWGAQGGSLNSEFYGGYGGYSTGTIDLISNDTLYLAIGERGKPTSIGEVKNGGYNGGGSASRISIYESSSSLGVGTGGGASSIYISSDVNYCYGNQLLDDYHTSFNETKVIGTTSVINTSQNFSINECNTSRKKGEFYKVEWRGTNLSDTRLEFYSGYYKNQSSSFIEGEGVREYSRRITDNLVEIWYEVLEDSYLTEFSLRTNEAHITIESKSTIRLNNPLIVSGGGSGAAYPFFGSDNWYKSVGASGGGFFGNSATGISGFQSADYWNPCLGGQQSQRSSSLGGEGAKIASTGSVGVSGFYNSTDLNYTSAGGGGGFYGGNSCRNFAGGGGSGYIGNPNLTDKIMYCYNCQESTSEEDETNIKTRSTTNVSEQPISNYAKIGHGYARITYIG